MSLNSLPVDFRFCPQALITELYPDQFEKICRRNQDTRPDEFLLHIPILGLRILADTIPVKRSKEKARFLRIPCDEEDFTPSKIGVPEFLSF